MEVGVEELRREMFVLKERGGEGGKEEDKEEEDEREKKYLKVQKEKDNFKLCIGR